jgi:hypothetical protein
MTTEYRHPGPDLDTDELPIVLSNGPTAGDKYEAIEEGHCDVCGYDRVRVTRKYGSGGRTCMNCDASAHEADDEMTPQKTDFDELKELREWDDSDDYTVRKVGEYGSRSRYTHGTEVFEYTNGSDLLKVFSHPSSTSTERMSLTRTDMHGLMKLLEDQEGFVTDWVNDELRSKQVRPAVTFNPNAMHSGRIRRSERDDDWKFIRLMIDVSRMDNANQVIHFRATDPNVSV